MYCLLCHEKIPRLRAWRTKSEFCCDEHAALYKKQTLERLLTDQGGAQAGAPSARPSALDRLGLEPPELDDELTAQEASRALPPRLDDSVSDDDLLALPPGLRDGDRPPGPDEDADFDELWRMADEVGDLDRRRDGYAESADSLDHGPLDLPEGFDDFDGIGSNGVVSTQSPEEALAALRRLAANGPDAAKDAPAEPATPYLEEIPDLSDDDDFAALEAQMLEGIESALDSDVEAELEAEGGKLDVQAPDREDSGFEPPDRLDIEPPEPTILDDDRTEEPASRLTHESPGRNEEPSILERLMEAPLAEWPSRSESSLGGAPAAPEIPDWDEEGTVDETQPPEPAFEGIEEPQALDGVAGESEDPVLDIPEPHALEAESLEAESVADDSADADDEELTLSPPDEPDFLSFSDEDDESPEVFDRSEEDETDADEQSLAPPQDLEAAFDDELAVRAETEAFESVADDKSMQEASEPETDPSDLPQPATDESESTDAVSAGALADLESTGPEAAEPEEVEASTSELSAGQADAGEVSEEGIDVPAASVEEHEGDSEPSVAAAEESADEPDEKIVSFPGPRQEGDALVRRIDREEIEKGLEEKSVEPAGDVPAAAVNGASSPKPSPNRRKARSAPRFRPRMVMAGLQPTARALEGEPPAVYWKRHAAEAAWGESLEPRALTTLGDPSPDLPAANLQRIEARTPIRGRLNLPLLIGEPAESPAVNEPEMTFAEAAPEFSLALPTLSVSETVLHLQPVYRPSGVDIPIWPDARTEMSDEAWAPIAAAVAPPLEAARPLGLFISTPPPEERRAGAEVDDPYDLTGGDEFEGVELGGDLLDGAAVGADDTPNHMGEYR